MSRVIKLSQKQLRSIINEAIQHKPLGEAEGFVDPPDLDEAKPKTSSDTAHDIALFLEKNAADIGPEDAEVANDASRALEEIRRIFYGSKWEAKITEMIVLCDEVADYASVDVGDSDDANLHGRPVR